MVAVGIGSALNAINQYDDALLDRVDLHWPKLNQTYIVSYFVSSFSARFQQ